MPARKKFKFTAKLSAIDGHLLQTAIFLPDDVVSKLPAERVRAQGTINDTPFNLAPQHKSGGRYFAVSASLSKAAKIKKGDTVVVSFELVDPDELHIPEVFEAVLAQDDEGNKKWNTLTVGYQRSLLHYITSVKNVDSKIKRSLEIIHKLKTGQIPRTTSSKKKGGK